jgi:hypothetical protein
MPDAWRFYCGLAQVGIITGKEGRRNRATVGHDVGGYPAQTEGLKTPAARTSVGTGGYGPPVSEQRRGRGLGPANAMPVLRQILTWARITPTWPITPRHRELSPAKNRRRGRTAATWSDELGLIADAGAWPKGSPRRMLASTLAGIEASRRRPW